MVEYFEDEAGGRFPQGPLVFSAGGAPFARTPTGDSTAVLRNAIRVSPRQRAVPIQEGEHNEALTDGG